MQAGGECDHPLEDLPDAQPGRGQQGGGMCGHDGPPVLYCTVLYCTVLYCTVLCCTDLHHDLVLAGRRQLVEGEGASEHHTLVSEMEA